MSYVEKNYDAIIAEFMRQLGTTDVEIVKGHFEIAYATALFTVIDEKTGKGREVKNFDEVKQAIAEYAADVINDTDAAFEAIQPRNESPKEQSQSKTRLELARDTYNQNKVQSWPPDLFTIFINDRGMGALVDENGLTYSPSLRCPDMVAGTLMLKEYINQMVSTGLFTLNPRVLANGEMPSQQGNKPSNVTPLPNNTQQAAQNEYSRHVMALALITNTSANGKEYTKWQFGYEHVQDGKKEIKFPKSEIVTWGTVADQIRAIVPEEYRPVDENTVYLPKEYQFDIYYVLEPIPNSNNKKMNFTKAIRSEAF